MPVYCLSEWDSGCFLGVADELILQEAARQKLTLVTYDRRTIPPLLKAWTEANYEHGGVIFVDEKTIPPSDIGGLIQALHNLFQESMTWDLNYNSKIKNKKTAPRVMIEVIAPGAGGLACYIKL